MADLNPYAAPRANLNPSQSESPRELTEPHGVAAGRGWSWIAGGFDLFKRDPVIWIVNMVIYLAIIIVMSFIPFIGGLATYLLSPIFTGGFMLGCYAEDRGERLQVGHLFAGFQRNTGTLAAVGGIYIAGVIVLMIVFIVLMALAGAGPGVWLHSFQNPTMEPNPEMAQQMGFAVLIAGLVVAGLGVGLAMAFWFAPVLVVMHSVTAVEAMRFSFRGCLRNVLPFLIYGLLMLVLLVIAIIPLGLGLLVLLPTLIAATYVAYRDIFTGSGG